MPVNSFDEWIASQYETLWPELFDPAVIDPTASWRNWPEPVLPLNLASAPAASPCR